MTSPVLQNLQNVRELLAQPEHWTQGCLAKNNKGKSCGYNSKDAVAFCIVGACYKSSPEYLDAYDTVKYFSEYIQSEGFKPEPASVRIIAAEWNDDPKQTHANMLETLDAAIKAYPC